MRIVLRRKSIGCWFCLATWLLIAARSGAATTVSPLYARGYSVIPEPQKIELSGGDFQFGEGWRLELGKGVQANDVAVESLQEGLHSRFRVSLSQQAGARVRAKTLSLAIVPNSVEVGDAQDRDRRELAEQAYKLVLGADRISITANTSPGLFYGIETLVQLLKPKDGTLSLPEGQIVDWPDLELRVIYWDDAHHLDHLEVLKRALRQAAFFKINGFSIKLEGHFQYKSAPAIVEPYALSPAELQELTDYGLRYHVQLIPYLDGPAHDAFILKHPEYAKLREYPESNYEFCVTNPDTYKLLTGMYQDLLEANKGVKYFLLSTDEPYYVGLAKNSQCDEATRAREVGSVGKLLSEFLTQAGGYLHDRGRTVIFWGEYPLKPDDIPSLPSWLVNGEVYGPEFDPVFKKHGMRQMVYVSTEGEEPLFPDYYILPDPDRLHPNHGGTERVAGMFDHISFTQARAQADLMGVFVAGWADMGLHPETFWLGYATGPAAGWHAASPDPHESMDAFYRIFYGPSAVNMGRVYQLLSGQSQFWADSWERTASDARKPIFGNSDVVFIPPRPAHDDTLALPPLPSLPHLNYIGDWEEQNTRRLQLAAKSLAQNDELLDLLHLNLERVESNRYNLEVLISVARLCRQNLVMLEELRDIDRLLKRAEGAARRPDARQAVVALDRILDISELMRRERNQALQETTDTWYKTWHPRVLEANGRRYLDVVDDVKDHRPVRTVDMSYLVYRELILPFGDWVEKLAAIRNQYAQASNLPPRDFHFNWKDIKFQPIQELAAEED